MSGEITVKMVSRRQYVCLDGDVPLCKPTTKDNAWEVADRVLRRRGRAAAYEIRAEASASGTWTGYRVWRDGEPVSGLQRHRALAETIRDGMIRRYARTFRSCLRCGTRFHSEGAHNRMCTPCRARPSHHEDFRVAL